MLINLNESDHQIKRCRMDILESHEKHFARHDEDTHFSYVCACMRVCMCVYVCIVLLRQNHYVFNGPIHTKGMMFTWFSMYLCFREWKTTWTVLIVELWGGKWIFLCCIRGNPSHYIWHSFISHTHMISANFYTYKTWIDVIIRMLSESIKLNGKRWVGYKEILTARSTYSLRSTKENKKGILSSYTMH